uniref:2-oxoacid:acceptor oxidoreductase family protein n=1 Tax=uncultured Senegalimassilia sp. TaxID=1714350 RepID=UPI00261EAB1B
EKGWQVRTAETIGMAQRGGNVVSHVRIGNKGEQVHAPLVSRGTADLIIAFEPAEAARVLPFLAPTGTLVFATTAVQPVTAALSKNPYRACDVIANMERALTDTQAKLVPVDDAALTKAAGSRKVLNSLLLAKALQTGCVPIDVEDLRAAIAACVKPRFVDMNLQAINVAVGE